QSRVFFFSGEMNLSFFSFIRSPDSLNRVIRVPIWNLGTSSVFRFSPVSNLPMDKKTPNLFLKHEFGDITDITRYDAVFEVSMKIHFRSQDIMTSKNR
ncbi:MAG: hypothetical protein ACW991_04140, partial [Candidatus Hodarchaeales archaeon]